MVVGSSIIYLLTYFLSATCLKKSKQKKIDGWFILAVMFPVFLATFRVNTGTDYNSYVGIFNVNAQLSFSDWFLLNRSFSGDRIGIWIFSKIANCFGSEKVFFFLFSFILCCSVFWVLKNQYSQYVFLVALGFLTTTFSTGLNICKQMLAAGIIFCGLSYVTRRKLLRYIMVVLLAMCFHITAACGIIIYFLYGKTSKNKALGQIVTIFGVVIALLLLPQILKLMGGRFAGYIEFDGVTYNRSFFLDCALLLMFIVLRRRYLKIDKRNDLFIFMFVLGVLLELTGFQSPYLKRIASYFTISQIVLLSQMPKLFAKNKLYLLIVIDVVYIVGIFLLTCGVLGQGDIIPYYTDLNIGFNVMIAFEICCYLTLLHDFLVHNYNRNCIKGYL